MNKLQKYLKPVSQKLGLLQFSSPNGLGFQVKKKLIVTDLIVGKIIFSISLLGLADPPKKYVEMCHQSCWNHTFSWMSCWDFSNCFWQAVPGIHVVMMIFIALLVSCNKIFKKRPRWRCSWKKVFSFYLGSPRKSKA